MYNRSPTLTSEEEELDFNELKNSSTEQIYKLFYIIYHRTVAHGWYTGGRITFFLNSSLDTRDSPSTPHINQLHEFIFCNSYILFFFYCIWSYTIYRYNETNLKTWDPFTKRGGHISIAPSITSQPFHETQLSSSVIVLSYMFGA